MEYSWFVELVTTLGFPIASVIAMGWFIWIIYKRSEKREDALRSQIVQSQQVNAEAIHTIALYAERLGVIESDVKHIKQDVMIISERVKD